MKILPINKSDKEILHVDATPDKEILHVDATPDKEYPLRILKAYRHNCDFLWSDSSDGIVETNPMIKALNDAQRKRAEILDRAISILESIKESF